MTTVPPAAAVPPAKSDGMPGGTPVQAVRTTGIYCRPDCTARPDPRNVTTFALPAAAEAAGYRACHRCRPYRDDSAPGVVGPELVCRAVRLVVDGALDDGTESELASTVGVSPRHLRRLFEEHLGVTPDGLARSRRAHFARRLLDDTDLPVTDVAFAAGFGSVRQLQRACTETFDGTPSELRARRRRTDRLAADGGLDLRLPHQGQLDWPALLDWLADRAVPGVEVVDGGVYRRTVVVDGDPGAIELRRGGGEHLVLRAHLPHWDGLLHVVRAARRLAGLDLDLEAAHGHLRTDPVLSPLLATRPGLRPPGAWDPFETLVRAVLGQQVSVAARTFGARLADRLGTRVDGLGTWGLTHTFPDAERLADDGAIRTLGGLGLTTARTATLGELAAAVVAERIELSAGGDLGGLGEIRGIGDWTVQYAALRLGEPDAFPSADLGLRQALGKLEVSGRGHDVTPTAVELSARAEPWRPWRAVAATHLWRSTA